MFRIDRALLVAYFACSAAVMPGVFWLGFAMLMLGLIGLRIARKLYAEHSYGGYYE